MRLALRQVPDQLTQSGVDVFGYVYTDMAQQPMDTVTATIADWFGAFPFLSGMFLDVGPPTNPDDPAQQEPDNVLAYYQQVAQTVRSSGTGSGPPPAIMLNCGGLRDARFANTCFDIAVWEQDWATYQKDSWWQAATSGGEWWLSALEDLEVSVSHVVNELPFDDTDAMTQAVTLAEQRNANWIYVFDGSSGGYDRLPTFWSAEVDAIAAQGTASQARLVRGKILRRRKAQPGSSATNP